MTIEVFEWQSLRTDLLSGLPILGVGAWGWGFESMLAKRGHRVIGMDPHPDMAAPPAEIPNLELLRAALVGTNPGQRDFMVMDNPEACYVMDLKPAEFRAPKGQRVVKVEALTLLQVMERCGVKEWDAVKTNCEGEEYNLLDNWPGPVARQVVINFHEHFRPKGEDEIQRLLGKMGEWYTIVQDPRDHRYYAPEINHWDTLVIRKDLA